ncbi:MAG: dihydropteroate synthase [Coriobacteriales bacterium]|jgi:5-methyltetrahydrofolate corrinoid/iron sulfur protein methyltransferase|nr:dihydropteroate synthase [Coriobacteriales bacterium]
MAKFEIIGERIQILAPEVREALATRNPEPILRRAKEQLDTGATYLDLNIGPAEKDGEELMKWGVKLLQENFDNVPLALDTVNAKAIEAGISVYNRSKGKPIVNSADAGERISAIDLAAANDAIIIALCSKAGVPRNNEERMEYTQTMLERGLGLGLEAEDMWFDPLTLVIKGMQEKQPEYFEFIRQLTDMGLKSVVGLSNASNGMPPAVRPKVDNVMMAMAMQCGLSAVIVNPGALGMMEVIKTAEIILDHAIYSDSYLDI